MAAPEVAVEFGKAAMTVDPLLGSVCGVLVSAVGVLFYLLIGNYKERLKDRDEMIKQYQDRMDKNTESLNKSVNVYEKNTEATVERNRATVALTEASNLLAQAFKSNESLIASEFKRLGDSIDRKAS